MKKLIAVSLFLGLSLGQLFAGTNTNGVDENGRLWGHAYFDIHSGIQSPVLGAMKYSNRAGFEWTKLYDNAKNFVAKEVAYKVSGRIVVPDSISTDSVYVTFGKDIRFWDYVDKNSSKVEEPASTLKVNTYPIYKFSGKINKKELLISDFDIAKVKQDDFGTKYVDFEMNFIIKLTSNDIYINTQKKLVSEVIAKNYAKKINSIRIKIAPKSRSFESKWQNAKIYVMDE